WLVKVTAPAGGAGENSRNNETKQHVRELSRNLLPCLPVADGGLDIFTKEQKVFSRFNPPTERTAVDMFRPNTIIEQARTFVNLIGLSEFRRTCPAGKCRSRTICY